MWTVNIVVNPTWRERVYSNNKFVYGDLRIKVSIFAGKFCIEIQNYSWSVQRNCFVYKLLWKETSVNGKRSFLPRKINGEHKFAHVGNILISMLFWNILRISSYVCSIYVDSRMLLKTVTMSIMSARDEEKFRSFSTNIFRPSRCLARSEIWKLRVFLPAQHVINFFSLIGLFCRTGFSKLTLSTAIDFLRKV